MHCLSMGILMPLKSWLPGVFSTAVAAGVHCQPFSRMGDAKGMNDCRSQSLPKALATSWILQVVMIVLECVPGVMQDAGFQGVVKQFSLQTGYRLSQVVLHLHDSWCSRRDRWIGVLVAPVMTPLHIPPMPKLDVRDLFAVFPVLPPEDQKQVALNLYELSKYHAYATGGISRQYVDLDSQAATLLHSLGNQMYHCACGCRPPLSEERLKQRGLVGGLIRLGTFQVHCNVEMEHCRYWHPDEMWALLGGKPGVDLGPNLRLSMAGIGQCVSPLMALWIFAHVRQHLDEFLGVSLCQPSVVLQEYAAEVLQECRSKWPQPASTHASAPHAAEYSHPVASEATDSGVEPTAPEPNSGVTIRFESLGVEHTVAFQDGATVRQLVQAEAEVGGFGGDLTVSLAGVGMDLDLPLQQGILH